MEFSVYYIDDTKLDHYYTQVSRHSDKKAYPLPDNQPLQELLPGLINFTRAPHKVSDACLELKTADYHRYLDMEYTLKEHTQDFGVSITRQDSLVIKTKLSLLVAALKDKMDQCSYGGDTRTLRTILKHIPGIIDEDSDFAPELLKQNGLSFLRSLSERDNYTNFDRKKVTTIVLNVLFKIVSYVDGLMSVFRDRSSVSWLYSQVRGCSDARNPEGRNITIAILYIFVDSDLDTDAGPSIGPHDLAVLSIKCAQEVHQREGTPPFSSFLDLLSDKVQSDPETVLAVIRLINKMLEMLKEADEMDLFDDLVMALLDQGLSKVMEKHKQGKTAKNKIVQEYNTFSKMLCQEYEDTGDLDSILQSCIHRRPSYQPGSYHSGSEGNLSMLDRDRAKRSSLTNNLLTPKLSNNVIRSELHPPRSMTPDVRLVVPTKVSKSSENMNEPEKTPFMSKGTKEWKRKTPLSNGIGMTSTPKPESANESKSFKRSDFLSAKDSYTPGTYRAIHSPAGDSGYQSGTSLSRSESNEKIISPYDRARKIYEDTNRASVPNLVFESVPDKSPSRCGLNKSPYSLKSTEKSEISQNSSHVPLTATKSHPYRDSLPSPAGPPRKLDSPFSSYSRPVTSKSLFEKQTEPTPVKQETTQPRIIGKMISQSDPRVTDNSTKVSSLESRWKRRESPPASESTSANSEFKLRETKSLQTRGRLDVSQIISAVQSSQTSTTDVPTKETTDCKAGDSTSSPYSVYTSFRNNQIKAKQLSIVKDTLPSKQETVPEKRETVTTDTAKPLRQRFKELALNSEQAVSVDEKVTTPTPVKMPTLTHPSFDKESPILEISKLQKQDYSAAKPADSPAVRPIPPSPSHSQRLQFAEFGCDLAPFSDASAVTIAPFSADLRWTPGEFVTQQTRAPQPNLLDKAEAKVPVPASLPLQDKPSAPSPVSSPTEDNPFAKQLAERRKSTVTGKEARVLIPLPEVDLAKHELSFGPIKFQELGTKYDKDPYETEVKKVSHVPGSIPPPPPDMPRANRIPDPPPNIPEVQTGPEPGKKGKRKLNFRWNLVGKEPHSERRRSFWKFDKTVEVPLEIIHSFTANPGNTPDRVLTKSAKSVEKRIQVLEVERRTSLGINLKCLEKFELRDVENNFRGLRKILTALDLEVMNEEIIEVLEKGVLISSFESELVQIRRAKQEALSLGQSVTLREEEKFILSLGEVESLKERISIATFCLRFHEKEEEIAKRLLILMAAATEVRSSPTFKDVLNTLLSIGNAVEHKQAGGFDLEFLQRAESYKDSCHKKDLINHAASCVIEKYPASTNLYSDFPNVHDAWRMEIDFVELRLQIQNEQEIWSKCKISSEQLKLANYDNLSKRLEQLGHKINKFFITLGRMENYYRDLYLYFGYDKYLADSQKVLDFLKILHNFSLAYKANHERILQIKEKMAQEKRREKTRGKKLPIAENIQVKMVEGADGEGTKSENGAEDDGTGYSRGVMNAVLEHRKEKKPKTGNKYRNKGNRREKRNSIRRTLNEEDGLIDIAKKELAESPTS